MIEDWLRSSKFSPKALVLWTSHPLYDDYWRQRELNHRYRDVNTAAIHIGGWFDIFTQGTLDAFNGYQTRGGPAARRHQRLLIGPWTHGVLQAQAGELKFPGGQHPPNHVEDAWRWFDAELKGVTNGFDRLPAVTYYVMGDVTDPAAPGNAWRTAAQWPPGLANVTAYYLHADHTLSPRSGPAQGDLTYTYDPQHPAPTIGGPQLTLPAGPRDQHTLERRPDVLVFTSAPLAGPLEVTGRVRVQLWIASDAPDTDFFAKLCDVYPDGRSLNLCEGQLRARFRRGFARARRLEPGRGYPLDLDLWSTSVVFNRGHRLRVDVTSSSAPGYEPNPNTGEPFRASSRTRVAHNRVLVDGRHASAILLPLVPNAAR